MAEASEKRQPKRFDELDLQIVALKAQKPPKRLREISEITGYPISTVFDRWDIIRESNWFLDACAETRELIPAAIDRVRKEIDAGAEGLSAALAVLNGLGIFKQRHELSGPNGGPIRSESVHVYVPHNGRDDLPLADVVPFEQLDHDSGNGNGSSGNGSDPAAA